MSYLIAGVVTIAFLAALLTLFMGKGKTDGKKKTKSKTTAQIVKEANKKLAKNPHDPAGLVPLGNVYFTSQIWDKAYNIYSELSKLDTNNEFIDIGTCYLRLGICGLQLEKLPEATQALLVAYKLNSTNFETNFYLGKTMFELGKFDKAVPLLRKANLANPEATGVNFLLAQSLYKGKKYKESCPFYKKALDEDPANKEALFNMADAMFQEGKGDKVLKIFLHLRADPTYGAKSCLRAGLFHTKVGQIENAIQDYEIGLKHENIASDIRTEIRYNLAQCCFDKKMIARGLELLKQIRSEYQNYKDVNSLINRYQELSQNSNLQIYVSSNSSDFVDLCRKIILAKYSNSNVKILNIVVEALYADILSKVYTTSWEDTILFRFFRTTGTTGEVYIREFHEHMSDVNAERGFCISAGLFSDESQ